MTKPGNSTFRRSNEWEQSRNGRGSNRRWMKVQWQVTFILYPAIEGFSEPVLHRIAWREVVLFDLAVFLAF